MGDDSRDPLDRQRTSRPRVGQALKNPAKALGLVLIAIGVVALGICLFSLARGQVGAGIGAVVVSVLATGAGSAWLAREASRLRELEREQNIDRRGSRD